MKLTVLMLLFCRLDMAKHNRSNSCKRKAAGKTWVMPMVMTMFSNRIRANAGHSSHTDADNNFY